MTRGAITPALTAEEWRCALTKEGVVPVRGHLSRFLPAHIDKKTQDLVLPDAIEEWTATETERHFLAALCLHEQPFGFTREEIKAVRQMLDHAERWIDYRWLGEWTAHKMAWGVVEKLEALLPPETP